MIMLLLLHDDEETNLLLYGMNFANVVGTTSVKNDLFIKAAGSKWIGFNATKSG